MTYHKHSINEIPSCFTLNYSARRWVSAHAGNIYGMIDAANNNWYCYDHVQLLHFSGKANSYLYLKEFAFSLITPFVHIFFYFQNFLEKRFIFIKTPDFNREFKKLPKERRDGLTTHFRVPIDSVLN